MRLQLCVAALAVAPLLAQGYVLHDGNCPAGTEVTTEAECIAAAEQHEAEYAFPMQYLEKPIGCVRVYYGPTASRVYFNTVKPGHDPSEHVECGAPRYCYCHDSTTTTAPTAGATPSPPTVEPTAGTGAPTAATTAPTAGTTAPTMQPTTTAPTEATTAPTAGTRPPTTQATTTPTEVTTTAPTEATTAPTTRATTRAPITPTQPPPGGLDGMALFLDGHSLIGRHMPKVLDQVAVALGRNHEYEFHIVGGASMNYRLTRGLLEGRQRDWQPVTFNMMEEVPSATRLSPGRNYDTLIVCEGVPFWRSLYYQRTLNTAGTYRDLLYRSPAARAAYLNEVWEGVPDGSYDRWIENVAYLKPMWECVVSIANMDPARRGDMQLLRGAEAVVVLVQRVRAGQVAGITNPDVLFEDDIHLSVLGNYYLGVYYYAVLYDRSPLGAPHSIIGYWGRPFDGCPNADQARELQLIAWEVAQLHKTYPVPNHSRAFCETVVKEPCEREVYPPGCLAHVDEVFAEALPWQ